jgi:hypothetical protein
MKIIPEGEKYQMGDIVFNEDMKFVMIITRLNGATIPPNFIVYRPTMKEAREYAVAHPYLFADGNFKLAWSAITIDSLTENQQYFIKEKLEEIGAL